MSGAGFDLGFGGGYLLPSSVSEEGKERVFSGNLWWLHDSANRYGLGFRYHSAENEGSDFYLAEERTKFLFSLQREVQNPLLINPAGRETTTHFKGKTLLIGSGEAGEETSFELGNETTRHLGFRLSDSFGIAVGVAYGNTIALPSAQAQETTPLFSIRLGFDARLFFLDPAATPAPETLTGPDATFYAFQNLNQLGLAYFQAKALSGPAALAQEYIGKYGGTGLPSPRMETTSSLFALTTFLDGMERGDGLGLQLKADSDFKPLMIGSLAASTLGGFLLAGEDESATLLTFGARGLLNLAHLGIANGVDLSYADRKGKSAEENQKSAEKLIGFRFLTSTLPFLLGSAMSDEKGGQVLLQAGASGMLATASDPDPAGTNLLERSAYHLLYENNASGGHFGFGIQRRLTDSHLFTGVKMLMQTSPVGSDLQENADSITGRDPLTQGPQAKTIALVGLETDTSPFTLAGAVRGLLVYGAQINPQAGVGLEQQLRLSAGDKTRFELGITLSEDLIDGNVSFGVSPFVGVSF